jgi:hypothetical protein
LKVFSGRILKVDKLPQLEWIIGIDNQRCLTSVSQQSLTHARSNLGIWLNLNMVLYLGIFGKSENRA